jgi:hypothetical protein
MLTTLCFALLFALQGAQAPARYPLQRFEVVRINPEDMSRLPDALRRLFSDPVPDGEPVDSLEAVTKRVGFTPRILKSPAVMQYVVTDPVKTEAKISVADLVTALSAAKVTNIQVPPAWDGVVVNMQQDAGVLADYGDFFIVQAAPLTMTAPGGFPVAQFMEVVLRVMGIDATQASALRQRFTANPMTFFPIAKRYDMDIRQVPIGSSTGLLLQNAEKGGELALMWSTSDRSYFLSGLLTEEQAIADAKSLQ